MLRLALIENLRRVRAQVIASRIDRDLADVWGDRFAEMTESDPKSVVLVIAAMSRSQPPPSRAFLAEMMSTLPGRDGGRDRPLTRIAQWLDPQDHNNAKRV